MRAGRSALIAATLIAAALLGACAVTADAPTNAPLSSQRIAEIIANPERSAADRAADVRRKPQQTLEFIGVRPGIVALDLSAGGGYSTELIARAVGPNGRVYGQSAPRDPARVARPPAAPEGGAAPLASVASAASAAPRTSASVFADRAARLQGGHLIAVSRPFESPVPPELAQGGLDLVTLMLNYHDLGHMEVDRARMNVAVFAALKPGGFYVITDNAGRPGTGISEAGTLHRIDEAFLRAEVERAGFRLFAEGDFLRNPNDPRDRNTPEPPQPKDAFALKFVKP